jgi:hypothetical protein
MGTIYPNDADGDALRRVAGSGADMSRPMTIDFSVASPNREAADQVAPLVAPHGFKPSVSHDEDTGTWTVYCGKAMLATYVGVVSAQAHLNELVAPLGASCDGWGTFGNTQ